MLETGYAIVNDSLRLDECPRIARNSETIVREPESYSVGPINAYTVRKSDAF